MYRRSIAVLLAGFFLLAGGAVQAGKEGGRGGANAGGRSPQHMSATGQENANSPVLGQSRGAERADARKSGQGLTHDRAGDKEKRGGAKKSGELPPARGR